MACRCWKDFLGSFLSLTSCFISHFGFGSFNLLVLPFSFSHFFLSHTLFSYSHQLNFHPKLFFSLFSLLRFFVVSSFFSHFLFLHLLFSPLLPSSLILLDPTLFFFSSISTFSHSSLTPQHFLTQAWLHFFLLFSSRGMKAHRSFLNGIIVAISSLGSIPTLYRSCTLWLSMLKSAPLR